MLGLFFFSNKLSCDKILAVLERDHFVDGIESSSNFVVFDHCLYLELLMCNFQCVLLADSLILSLLLIDDGDVDFESEKYFC